MIIATKVISVFAALCLQTQTQFGFKVEAAEVLRWSGGVCCSSGERYNVILSWNATAHDFKIDSLWANNKGFAINITHTKQDSGKRQNKTLHYEISRNNAPRPNNEGVLNDKKIKPPIAYKGVALIRYISGGQKHYLMVKKYTKTDIVNYP